MLVADLEEGDLLCFPSFWLHEVHNLTPDSKALTNAVPWPKKESQDKGKEEEKREPKRTFETSVKDYVDYKLGVME